MTPFWFVGIVVIMHSFVVATLSLISSYTLIYGIRHDNLKYETAI
jgi:hypothetical protein